MSAQVLCYAQQAWTGQILSSLLLLFFDVLSDIC
jgi:hypothetical protein